MAGRGIGAVSATIALVSGSAKVTFDDRLLGFGGGGGTELGAVVDSTGLAVGGGGGAARSG